MILLFYTSQGSWDDRHAPPWPAIGWDGVLWIPCVNWPRNVILPILASQVARIILLSRQFDSILQIIINYYYEVGALEHQAIILKPIFLLPIFVTHSLSTGALLLRDLSSINFCHFLNISSIFMIQKLITHKCIMKKELVSKLRCGRM
jgi:hypothetical protein